MNSFDTGRFIVEIENRPAIWDTFSTDYCNRDLKKKCWQEIVDIFGGNELDIVEKKDLGETLQKRWKSIRGCYTRELSRRKNSKSGSGSVRKSEYIYYQQLQFLQKVVTTSALEPEQHSSDTEISQNHKVERRKKKKSIYSSDDDAVIKILNESVVKRDKREQLEQDEDRLFLLSLLGTLKKVPEDKKLSVKIQMMSSLDEAIRSSVNEIENIPVINFKEDTCHSDSSHGTETVYGEDTDCLMELY